MTNSRRAVATQQPIDTHEMVVVHRAFRREVRLLTELIAAVPDGDRTRARILARHLRWYCAGLHNHHEGEDELLWRVLRERCDLRAIVAQMEDEHEQIAARLGRTISALVAWEADAGIRERDQLGDALSTHRPVLERHLDDEETELLPLAGQHLRQDEWDALGVHFVRTTRKGQLLIFLGAVLEDANAQERATILGAMPLAARIVWRTVGRTLYARRVRRVRAQRSPAAAAPIHDARRPPRPPTT